MERGTILKALSGFYYVGITGTDEIVECHARGKMRLANDSPLVGDGVLLTRTEGGRGTIVEILPRKNSFIRPAVANLDQLVLIVSESTPVTDPYLIDRMLAMAQLRSCGAVIVINKCDLSASTRIYDIYEKIKYPTMMVSAETGEGIDLLRHELAGRISAFTGNSGVGKSSLLNALAPEFHIGTGDVSEKLGRGRHTTRHVELFRIGDALIADTPGFAAFDAQSGDLAEKSAIQYAFPEFSPYLDRCRFRDCSHIKEAGCAVLEALGEGKIHASRHASYVRLYEQARQLKDWGRK